MLVCNDVPGSHPQKCCLSLDALYRLCAAAPYSEVRSWGPSPGHRSRLAEGSLFEPAVDGTVCHCGLGIPKDLGGKISWEPPLEASQAVNTYMQSHGELTRGTPSAEKQEFLLGSCWRADTPLSSLATGSRERVPFESIGHTLPGIPGCECFRSRAVHGRQRGTCCVRFTSMVLFGVSLCPVCVGPSSTLTQQS